MTEICNRKTSICIDCGLPCYKNSIRCRKCWILSREGKGFPVYIPMGLENNPNWKGDNVSPDNKRKRVRRRYALTNCEVCGKPGRDRHHKNANLNDISPGNIIILCRRCHMAIDGRIDKLRVIERKKRPPLHNDCQICGREYRPLRKGRCSRCDDYYRRHGMDKQCRSDIYGDNL